MFKKSILFSYFVLFLTFISNIISINGVEDADEGNNQESDLFSMNNLNVSNLGTLFREMIHHFKLVDPVGLPGAPIPDPMPAPDTKYNNFPTTLYLKKSMIHGLSQFRIEEIQFNLYSLEVELLLTYQKLEMLGNYTASSLFSGKSQGGYNVTIIDVSMGGTAKLDTNINGHLEASHIDMDLIFKDIRMNFENPNYLINFFQGMVNTIGTFVFDQIKPYVLREVNTNIQDNMNNVFSTMNQTFPNSISPLDLAIAIERKRARKEGLDPFPVDNYSYSAGLLTVEVKDIQLTGLASFYRLGNITVYIKKNTVSVDAHVSTQQLEGKCVWEATLGGLLSTYGSTSFSVQYVQIQTRFNQSLDLRNTPLLEAFDITLGNIQLRMDGLGTFDYVLESLVNVLPNILRHQIVNALEGVLKQRIQTVLSSLDVEDLVVKNVISQFEKPAEQNVIINEDYTYDFIEKDDPHLIELYEQIYD